jgi:hypothetical protein
VAWNAILRATNANQFFTDDPIPLRPSAGRTPARASSRSPAVSALLLGFGPLRTAPAQRLAVLAGLGALGALLVDIYLY